MRSHPTFRPLRLASACAALLAFTACGGKNDIEEAVQDADTAGMTAVPSGTPAGDSARAGFGGAMQGTTLMGDSIRPQRDTVTPTRRP